MTGLRAPGATPRALLLAVCASVSASLFTPFLARADGGGIPGTLVAQLGAPGGPPKTPGVQDPGMAAPGTSPAPAASPPTGLSTSPAPAPLPGEAVPGSNTGAPANAGAAYTTRLHDLERRMDELKEQVYRSKARLNLLKETVLGVVVGASQALITHRNEMGSTYTLIKLVYALDGAEIYAKSDDTGHLGDNKEFEIFNGTIVPGNHTLSVLMVYQGNGFGVFSYLKGYKFNVRGSNTFTAAESKQTQLKVVGFEKGNPITTDPKDRPAIDFRINVISANRPSQANAGATPPAPAATPEGTK